MKNIKIEAIFFDLDGTIVDTEPAAVEAIVETLSKMGIQVSQEHSEQIVGKKWEKALEEIYDHYKVEVSPEQLIPVLMKNYRSILETRLPTVQGSVEAIKKLSTEYPLALVSGSRRSEIEWALKKLGIYDCFKLILGSEDYLQSKPSPEGYQKALKLLGLKASSVVVFEDSTAGIRSGRDAGLWVVGVSAANYYGHNLDPAHRVIRDFSDVDCNWIVKCFSASG